MLPPKGTIVFKRQILRDGMMGSVFHGLKIALCMSSGPILLGYYRATIQSVL